jgi:NADPH-dependent curcumin reductase CurA
VKTREVRFVSRPVGQPSVENFEVADAELPEPGEGEALVRNLVMSLDPYMRTRMYDRPSYAPAWEVGQIAQGAVVGEVMVSNVPAWPVGTFVLSNAGWREHCILSGADAQIVEQRDGVPLSSYLGALGMPGMTAYAGLFRVAEFAPGDVVFVSAAAGAVGSLVGQFAKAKGALRVIGSAGTKAKVRYLVDELGFDAAFDYHNGLASGLSSAAPDGIDVYFDAVGGEHLQAAIDAMNLRGRVAMSGALSQYGAVARGVTNLTQVIYKRLTLRGFLYSDYADLEDEQVATVSGWIVHGQVHTPETITNGLENAPDAFIRMLKGDNLGKALVRLADPTSETYAKIA